MTPLYGQFSDSLKTTLEISVRHRYVCRRIFVGASAGIGWRVYAIHVGAESDIGLVGCLRPAGARLGQRLPGDAPAGRIVCGRRLCDDTSVLTLPYLPAYSIIMIALHKVAAPRLDRTAKAADEVAAYERIDSTHAKARRLIERGRFARNDDGGIAITVVAAGAMDDARGRLGRPWACVPGHSFAISFIVTIPESVATDDAVNGWMSMIAGLATLDAIEGTLDECGAVPFDPECGFHLKWPNDIYCHGLKLGSTFTQVASPPDRHGDVAVIFSVGVNLSVPADRLPTPESTSLRMHVAPLPPTAELIDMIAARLVASLRTRLEAFVQMPLIQSSRLRSEMHHVCWMMGRQIDAQLIDGRTIAGKVVSLNDDASISVRTASGETERLSTGDIGLMV